MRTLFRTLVLLVAGILGVLRRLCMSFRGENSMRFFTVILLSGILCLFCFQMAESAEVKVLDNSVFVGTDAYEVEFTDGVITHFYNKLTEETYTLPLGVGGVTGFRGRSGLLKRDGRSIWTDRSTLTQARKVAPLKAEIVFRQGLNEFRLFIGVDTRSGDLLLEQEGTSDTEGVYGIQWGCVNLNVRNLDLILPADGGQIINTMSPFTSRDFQYPFSWEVQLAILQGEQGGFFVRGADETFQFKTLHYEKYVDSFALGFETQNQAPFDALTSAKSVVWRLNTYSGDWRVPARQYRDWMEQTFDPWRLDEMPAWVGETGLVVTYIDPRLDVGTLDKLADQVDPRKTLLYVTQWRKYAFDVNFPDYTAKPELGRFVEAARQYGFRVMAHVNLIGVNADHPLYAEVQKFQYRNPWTGNLMGWFWDRMDIPRNRIAAINPASAEFRKYFVQQLKEVWQKYGVDAFFLDVSSRVENNANGLIEGLNAGQGNVLLHKELAAAMPGVVFGGESLHEVTFFRESFAQRWKNPPQWDPTRRSTPHPVCAFLFFPYTVPVGYLGLPNPDQGLQLYQEYLNAYEIWGVLPTLRLSSVEDLGPERVRTQELLSIARTWQQRGLKPDFESDWTPNTLFQYVGEDGGIAALKKTETGATFVLPEESLGYERVYGVTQVKTQRNIPHWRAYNETTLLGLHPEKSYFLSDTRRDFSQAHINALPDGVSVKESRVTENAALFRLERLDVSHEIDLLSEMHLVRTGIVHKGKELPRQRGATFQKMEVSIAGVRKSGIDAHPPYEIIQDDNIRRDTSTFGEWTLSLPDTSTPLYLDFDIGLREGSDGSDGVTFIVSIQGTEIFRRLYNAQRWEHVRLDLTPYRKQRVTLRFSTTPGPVGNGAWDWAMWGAPEITYEPVRQLTEIGFFIPDVPTRSFPDTLENQGNGQYWLKTQLPALVLILFGTPQQTEMLDNLRDAHYIAGLQFDSIFRKGSSWGSGRRSELTATGVRKQTLDAYPPPGGETVLQYLLALPVAEDVAFSFSMGLPDENCSIDGLFFKVLIDGQNRFEHFAFNEPGWVDTHISLSEFAGETVLLELVTDSGETPSCDYAHWADLFITAKGVESSGDVNQDGIVNVLDIILVAQNLGQKSPSNPRVDVNKDGQVNILDLVFVAERLGEKVAAAPSQMDVVKATPFSTEDVIVVRRALNELEAIREKSDSVKMTVQFLRAWLANANHEVRETRLLPNYPNPFNPETWIPYQLADAADVSMGIYDVGGRLVRTIPIGFKPVGYYLTRERAAYWDGRNEIGESVSSGIYFIQFLSGDFAATRRIVVVK